MSVRDYLIAGVICFLCCTSAGGQSTGGQLSGSIDANANFFLRDEDIGAVNTPQYDDELIGIESWLNLKYRIKGFEVGLRLDAFSNSNLLNPNDAYSDAGIGRIYANWQNSRLQLTAGHFYDQIGSGVIFRAYEERALLIDNALFGVRVKYQVKPDWEVRAFGGRQKSLFGLYDSVLGGAALEGYISNEKHGWSMAPGIGLTSKTISEDQMDALDNVLSTYTPEDFIDHAPFHNIAVALYNTLQSGNFTWYFEGAYKSEDIFFDVFASRELWTGEQTVGKFVKEEGFVFYNTLSFAQDGLGVSLESKVTSNFNYRTDPFVALNRGFVNFLPPMIRFNTYRLTARYAPATQELGEFASQLEATYSPDTKRNFLFNASYIDSGEGEALYREIFTRYTIKKPRKSTLILGLQLQWYNQEVYEGKAGVEMVRTVTPFTDYLIRLDRSKAIRFELQYMRTRQDFGSWLFGLVEFSVAPHWIFEVSDMWNVQPYENDRGVRKNDPLHFPTLGVTYSLESHRFTARFVKQVEGVVCSGGVCRLEPAFSGFRLQWSSQF